MWMFHCHIELHLASGMYTHYMVEPAGTEPAETIEHHQPVAQRRLK